MVFEAFYSASLYISHIFCLFCLLEEPDSISPELLATCNNIFSRLIIVSPLFLLVEIVKLLCAVADKYLRYMLIDI